MKSWVRKIVWLILAISWCVGTALSLWEIFHGQMAKAEIDCYSVIIVAMGVGLANRAVRRWRYTAAIEEAMFILVYSALAFGSWVHDRNSLCAILWTIPAFISVVLLVKAVGEAKKSCLVSSISGQSTFEAERKSNG
jgi:hypothetical protein